ncbi:hypothetical protein ACFYU8_08790 [Brevibacillus sp. NPDC003359]|uniref:hypothetical protein n=1 Tax=unclassified Brevibacillus TaxID=2684853 RepID=UPI003685ED05
MKEPLNASLNEIQEWAYDKASLIPTQDWDLAITDLESAPLLLKLSIDPKVLVEKRLFFLACLYLLVGETIFTGGTEHNSEGVRLFVEDSSSISDQAIQKWVSRSRELFNNPDLFEYNRWCNGELIFIFWDD